MNAESAHAFTLKKLFFGDTLLNWFIAVVLIGFPKFCDSLLGTAQLFPYGYYRVLGVIFLLYAAWQTYIIIKVVLTPEALWFSAILAEVPVALLTIGLVALDLPLKPLWRIILWIANFYMLFLGVWYIFVARLVKSNPHINSGIGG